jgi:TRAP-type uncharacterized transport system substrate-binding protein
MGISLSPKVWLKSLKMQFRASLVDLFDISPVVAIMVLCLAGGVFFGGLIFFINSAPPKELTISAGPEGSMFYAKAELYQRALSTHGIKVNILTSNGSMENLDRITESQSKVDIALVQSGIIDNDHDLSHIFSLGAVANQPIFFFYRGQKMDRLAQATQMKLAIGHESSGTNKLAMQLLKLNHIVDNGQLVSLEGHQAIEALLGGEIEGAFIMGEKVEQADLLRLLRAPQIHLMNFNKNANAYIRKIDYLNVFKLPEGVVDFQLNIPEQDITLIGPMVELVVSDRLHPALSDLILDAASSIHAKPDLFQRRGEFPIATAQTIPLSSDAYRFYKSGKTFLYRYLPFGIASLLNRTLFVLLPMLVVLFPILKFIPWVFRMVNQLRIRHLYKSLMQVEQTYRHAKDPEVIKSLHQDFDLIESRVSTMHIRSAYADQFYHLRGHIDYVKRLMARTS